MTISSKNHCAANSSDQNNTAPPPKPFLPTEEGINQFPAEIAERQVCGLWTYSWNGTKWTKPPCNAKGQKEDRGLFQLT
ncbi:MAG: hypothetical protein ABL962_19260, partial [Fimbriimonadaceae bacterium]